jgi:AraC-like DNA-binding protein
MCEDHDDPLDVQPTDVTGYVDIVDQLLKNYRCNVRPVSFTHFTAPWGISAPPSNAAKSVSLVLLALSHGQCYYNDEHTTKDIHLQPGDIFVFRNDCVNTLKDDPQTPTTDLMTLLNADLVDSQLGLNMGGGGDATRFMTCFYVFKQAESARLLNVLPRFIHVQGRRNRFPGETAELIQTIQEELVNKLPGWRGIAEQLSRALLLHVMRCHFAQEKTSQAGQQGNILSDPEVFHALKCLHRHPGKSWTVHSLANEVGMSRSAFAARFQQCLNQTPMAYLHEIRMHWACSLLRDQKIGIKRIANELCYSSDASFSSAFKRWAGVSPGQFRKQGDLPAELKSNLYLRALVDA